MEVFDFATLGVGGVLAGMLFYFYRQDANRYIEQWRGSTLMLVEVIREHTKNTSENTEVLRALHKRFDKLEGVRDESNLNQPNPHIQ